jgi:alanine-glyoxylate transaminase/serine-glyoxylate transaminase/serine-pyruvate transaminase
MSAIMPMSAILPVSPLPRVLLGPGPSCLPPEVTSALSAPMMGHMDPAFTSIMDNVRYMLGKVFQTQNSFCISLPGGGMAGMQAAFSNIVEPGDTVIIGVAGYFAGRMVSIAERLGARAIKVEAEWGKTIPPQAFEAVLKQEKVKAVAVVHGETSTGVQQPVAEISRLAHKQGACVIVDAVASLGGVSVPVDEWEIDICYGGSQKCLSAPPGVAVITVNEQTMEAIRTRKTPIESFYLDLSLLEKYWLGAPRAYHHTAPVPLVYALHEALRLTLEEGLEARFDRHARLSRALLAGLESMGLQRFADTAHRLPSVTTVRIPEGVDDKRVRKALLDEFNIEIGGGLGPVAGKVWRIGLMGYSASFANVVLVLGALETLLAREGYRVPGGAVLAAAASLEQG